MSHQDDSAEETYNGLPDSIKSIYSFKEWQWLPPERKNNIEHLESVETDGYTD